MNIVIEKLFKVLGWQRLVLMVWNAAKPAAMEAAKKTETKFDDNVVELVDELVHAITAK